MEIGGGEWLVIIFVILLLFGADKIPELARGLGKGIHEFKRATDDIKREITEAENHSGMDFKVGEIREIKDSVSNSLKHESNLSSTESFLSLEINSVREDGGKLNSVADVYDGEGI